MAADLTASAPPPRWLVVELRHGGILKLFLADRLEPSDRLAIVERIRDHHRRARHALQRARPTAERRWDRRGRPPVR